MIISELIILKDVGLNPVENCKGWLSIGARKSDIITMDHLLNVIDLAFYLNHLMFTITLLYSYCHSHSGHGYFDFIGRNFTLNLKKKKKRN